MNKGDLVAIVAEKMGSSKEAAAKSVDAVFAGVQEALCTEGKLQLVGFGNFEVKDKAERQGINPATGAAITIAASKAIGFKAGKALKDAVNK